MALVGNILLGTASTPAVSSIASAVASSVASAVAEDTLSSKIPWGALEYSGTVITAISGSAIGGQGGGGDTSQCLPKSASGDFYPMTGNPSGFVTGGPYQPSGDYAYNSGLSGKLDTTAQVITSYGTQGGRVYSLNGSGIQAQYAVSANNWNGASGKLDTSASSSFYPMTGNPSGFLTAHQSLSAYVPKSSISAQSATWNTVSSKADSSAVHTYTGVSPVVVDNTADKISLSATKIALDNSLRYYTSGTSGFIGMTYPTQIVANSSQATGTNIIYIVTGSN